MNLEPLSPSFLALATAAGLPEQLAVALWERYQENCDKTGFHPNARGWNGWVKQEVRSYNRLRKDLADRAEREERKRLADEAYSLTAISHAEYMASLAAKLEPNPAERRLLEFRAPLPGESIEAWFMAAFRGWRLPAQERPAKPCVRCGCGVHSWWSEGRLYEAATCQQCGRAEFLERQRLKAKAETE